MSNIIAKKLQKFGNILLKNDRNEILTKYRNNVGTAILCNTKFVKKIRMVD